MVAVAPGSAFNRSCPFQCLTFVRRFLGADVRESYMPTFRTSSAFKLIEPGSDVAAAVNGHHGEVQATRLHDVRCRLRESQLVD